jgi:hypothetical protein
MLEATRTGEEIPRIQVALRILLRAAAPLPTPATHGLLVSGVVVQSTNSYSVLSDVLGLQAPYVLAACYRPEVMTFPNKHQPSTLQAVQAYGGTFEDCFRCAGKGTRGPEALALSGYPRLRAWMTVRRLKRFPRGTLDDDFQALPRRRDAVMHYLSNLPKCLAEKAGRS